MNVKTLVWAGAFVGSTVGGALPMLWGGSMFGMSSIILSMLGGLAGIWAGWKLSQMI